MGRYELPTKGYGRPKMDTNPNSTSLYIIGIINRSGINKGNTMNRITIAVYVLTVMFLILMTFNIVNGNFQGTLGWFNAAIWSFVVALNEPMKEERLK